eukprot:scaffold482_cov266-Amphora_coffeaeformis.AAC.59
MTSAHNGTIGTPCSRRKIPFQQQTTEDLKSIKKKGRRNSRINPTDLSLRPGQDKVTMRFYGVPCLLLFPATSAFISPKQTYTRTSFAVKAFDGADGLLEKLAASDSTSFAPPPPPAPAVVAAAPPAVVESASIPSTTDVVMDTITNSAPSTTPPSLDAVAPAVDQVTSTATDLTSSFGDLPIIPIAIGAIAVIAAVAVLASGGGGGEEVSSPAPTPTSAPAPASSGAADLSIPYDAAARLAYEKAGSPGDYASFKAKYEADAIAAVKAKQKK